MKKLIVILLVTLMCTGCWNYKELTELGIVSAMAISKNENDMYEVDLQMINIIEGGDNGISESPITVMSGEGNTIGEAIRSINLKSSKVFFSSSIEYIIIDKSVVKNDLKEVLDFLTRDTKLSLNFLIITSTIDKPRDILSALSQFNMNAASNVSELIKRGEERYGASYSLNFKDYLAQYLAKGVTPVYPNVHLVGDKKDSETNENLEDSNSDNYIEILNLVSFDKDGNIIELDTDESFGYNFLKNHVENAAITSECENGYFTIETLKSDVNFIDKLNEGKLTVKGEIEADVFYYGCKYNLNDDKTLDRLSKSASKQIENYIEKTISLAQSNKTDFIGIGNYIYKNKKDYFDFEKDDWDSTLFPELDIDYDIKVTLFKQGNLKGDI